VTDRIDPVDRDPLTRPVEPIPRLRLLTPAERERARRERERRRREKPAKDPRGGVDHQA